MLLLCAEDCSQVLLHQNGNPIKKTQHYNIQNNSRYTKTIFQDKYLVVDEWKYLRQENCTVQLLLKHSAEWTRDSFVD